MTIIPQWTERFTADDVTGEDQLGVEGAAQSYQQWLVPGIITVTDHARYYSFYCWVLSRFIHAPNSTRRLDDFRGTYFKRHEVAFILGCYSHHMGREALPGLIGGGNNNANARRIWQSGDPMSLDAEYFVNQLGGFGQYYRSAMQAMGLVDEQESPRWVYRLTTRGKQLADAFEDSIRTTTYYRSLDRNGVLTHISRDTASEYGTHACLCAQALANGRDREPLCEAFFRLSDAAASPGHRRRRLMLGLTLDLVAKSGGAPLRQTLRSAMYLGQYTAERDYIPADPLRKWYARWRLVQVRHCYTAALQALWGVFLDHLRQNPTIRITFDGFVDWLLTQLPAGLGDTVVSHYVDAICADVGLSRGWSAEHAAFQQACRQQSNTNELVLFNEMWSSGRNPAVLAHLATRILCQLFLRFHSTHESKDTLWQEMAQRPRLPMAQFVGDFSYYTRSATWRLQDLLVWLYREYILGQHEFIALEKLRNQGYDTYKFDYHDGLFSWPVGKPDYQEPLRFPGLRLLNGLTILSDLGLVEESDDGACTLTADGENHLRRVLEGDCGD